MSAAPDLWRPVRDIVAQRLSRSRGSLWGPHLRWPAELPLRDAVAADSIDLVDAAEGVIRQFGIDELGWEDALLIKPSLAGWGDLAAAALAAHGVLRFASSGSQGGALEHRHPLATLDTEAAHLAGLLGSRTRLVCAVPTQHIYGFIFGVLLPQRLQCPLLDACGLPPTTLRRQLQAGDLLVAHPLLWSRLAEVSEPWPADLVGTSSTAPIDAALVEHLREQGLSRLLEVYGSSETAGIGWRADPRAAFELFPRWQAADADGLVDADGQRFPVPDAVTVSGRQIRPLGRRDRAVQVAGLNVYPEQVARVLSQAPGVAEASVRLDPASGRLKAQIVPAAGTTLDEDGLRAWCAERLSAAERPARISIVGAISRNVLGKSADW